MTHKNQIPELISLLYQERKLLADLIDKRKESRLWHKSEILKLCKDNPDRFDRLLLTGLLKQRASVYEVDESVIDFFSNHLKGGLPLTGWGDQVASFKAFIYERNPSGLNDSSLFLLWAKRHMRSLENGLLIALHQLERNYSSDRAIELKENIAQLYDLIWEEKKLDVFIDTELEKLIQGLARLLKESIVSIERLGLAQKHLNLFLRKLSKLRSSLKGDKGEDQDILSQSFAKAVIWDELPSFRTKISQEQLTDKISTNLLSKFWKQKKRSASPARETRKVNLTELDSPVSIEVEQIEKEYKNSGKEPLSFIEEYNFERELSLIEKQKLFFYLTERSHTI